MIGKTNDKTCILEKLKIGNVIVDTSKEISDELAYYFANVGSKYTSSIKKPDSDITDNLKKIKQNDNSLFLSPTTTV